MEEKGPDSERRRPGKAILMGMIAIVVVAAVVMAVFIPMLGGSDDRKMYAGQISEIILDVDDLGDGWNAQGYSDDHPANVVGYDSAGKNEFRINNSSGGLAHVVQISMIKFGTEENASMAYENMTLALAGMSGSYLNPRSAETGDGSTLYDINRTMSGHDGKVILVLERNIMLYISYSSQDNTEVTDQMIIGLAEKQIGKLE